jgi:hypothetical protein
MKRKVITALVAAAGGAALSVPGVAIAAKHPSPNGRHRISLFTSENPVTYGDSLVLFGRLTGPNNGRRLVVLWHHVNGTGPGFTVVQTGRTDAAGFFAFQRVENVVKSNREWFVTSLAARSRTIREKVVDQVTLNGPPDGSPLQTGQPYTFSGTVAFAATAAGQPSVLQRQNAATGAASWNTIDHGVVGADGSYTITHRFVVPGDANIRVLVRANGLHIASPSAELNYEISQTQAPGLSINANPDPMLFGGGVVVSGTLSGGAANTTMTLLSHLVGQPGFTPVTTTQTDASGNYVFPSQSPQRNTFYEVQGGGKTSAVVFEGVRDVLNASAAPTTILQGQTVTFSGNVAPDHTGHVIWLQEQNATATGFHTVQVAQVLPGSTYSIVHQLFAIGTHTFRVQIPGGPENEGAVSQSFTITVNPAAASQLPQTQPSTQSQGQ